MKERIKETQMKKTKKKGRVKRSKFMKRRLKFIERENEMK